MVIAIMWFKNTKHEVKICHRKGSDFRLDQDFQCFHAFVLDFALSTEIKYNYMQWSEALFILDWVNDQLTDLHM